MCIPCQDEINIDKWHTVGVLLLVDSVEGPMPQTRFVLRKVLPECCSNGSDPFYSLLIPLSLAVLHSRQGLVML